MEIEQTVNLTYVKIDEIDKKLNDLLDNSENLSQGGNSNNGNLTTIQNDITNLGSNTNLIKEKVNEISTKTDNIDEKIDNYSNNVSALESSIKGIDNTTITGVNMNVNSVLNNLTLLSNNLIFSTNAIMGEDEISLTDLKGEENITLTDINNNLQNLGTNSGADYSEQLNLIESNVNEIKTTTNVINNNVITINSNTATTANSILTMQNDIEIIKAKLSTLVHEDNNYVGKDFSDYPLGTIIQTYDYDERNLAMSTSNSLTLPKIYFCAEAESAGTIKITLNFMVQTTLANVLITTTLNDTEICQETFTVSELDHIYTYEKTFAENLNQTNKGNNIFVSMSLESVSGTKTLVVSKQKIEITAPNADIINKLCNFDVVYLDDGKYHIADCTSGTAKIAEVNALDMNNSTVLEFTDTNIATEQYKFTSRYQQFDSNYIFDDIGYLYYGQDNFYYLQYKNSSELSQDGSLFCVDWHQILSTKNTFTKLKISTGQMIHHYFDENDNPSVKFGIFFQNNIKVVGLRLMNKNANENIKSFLLISKDGEITLRYSFTENKNISLGYGTDATLYLKNFISTNEYTFEVYIKQFDKIIKKEIKYNNGYTIISSIEMGKYEKFFKMPNNDYFVVKNNQLEYYKSLTQ